MGPAVEVIKGEKVCRFAVQETACELTEQWAASFPFLEVLYPALVPL